MRLGFRFLRVNSDGKNHVLEFLLNVWENDLMTGRVRDIGPGRIAWGISQWLVNSMPVIIVLHILGELSKLTISEWPWISVMNEFTTVIVVFSVGLCLTLIFALLGWQIAGVVERVKLVVLWVVIRKSWASVLGSGESPTKEQWWKNEFHFLFNN